jgi:lipoprotein-releasing system ATP-binding protein
VFEALIDLISRTGVAALIATHNMDLARRMHRVLRLEHGLLVELDPATLKAY